MMNEIIVCKNCCTCNHQWSFAKTVALAIIVCKYNCCTFKKFALAWLGAESKHWQSWMILQAYIFSLALPHEWSPLKVPQVVPQMMRRDFSSRLNLKEASRSVHQWTTIADYSCWKASNPDWLTAKSHQKWLTRRRTLKKKHRSHRTETTVRRWKSHDLPLSSPSLKASHHRSHRRPHPSPVAPGQAWHLLPAPFVAVALLQAWQLALAWHPFDQAAWPAWAQHSW